MARHVDFWTWQLDQAAEQSRTRTLSVVMLVVYLLGAALLIARPRLNLTAPWGELGLGLIALALMGSAVICARVVMTRARHSLR